MIKCPFCDFEYSDLSELENHLLQDHFLNMKSYYEQQILKDSPSEQCFKCGKLRSPLTYIEPNTFYLPCWSCSTNPYERKQNVEIIKSAISDYYGKIVNDRYLQMFLVSDTYFNETLYHDYNGFKEVLKQLHKFDRNKIWFLDWIEGYPKVICKENIEGIKVISIDDRYEISSVKNSIKINSWSVNYPEIIPFDQRHHSRYNILNTSSDSRNTKRLRLKDEKDQCVKFFNIPSSSCKSLFRLSSGDGEFLDPNRLSEQDLTVTKLVLLRNKSFMKLICNSIDELIKNSGVLSDSVFLKNTITIDPDKQNTKIHLSWLPDDNKKDNYINISIL